MAQALQAIREHVKRSPEARRRLGRVYALLLRLPDAETPEANADQQNASGAGRGTPGRARTLERL
jgi:hypothetical protein